MRKQLLLVSYFFLYNLSQVSHITSIATFEPAPAWTRIHIKPITLIQTLHTMSTTALTTLRMTLKKRAGFNASKLAVPIATLPFQRGSMLFARMKHLTETEEIRCSFMYPNLHDAVADHLRDTKVSSIKFHDDDTETELKDSTQTNIIGHFKCLNSSCDSINTHDNKHQHKTWKSGTVCTVVRFYLAENSYNALVYNQRCKVCNGLGTFEVNTETYINKISRCIKKKHNVPCEDNVHSKYHHTTKPHRADLCEGCKKGQCAIGDKAKKRGLLVWGA